MCNEEDRKKIAELIQLRPAQFCLLMKAVLGTKRMEEVMLGAVALAKDAGATADPVALGMKPLEIRALGPSAQ